MHALSQPVIRAPHIRLNTGPGQRLEDLAPCQEAGWRIGLLRTAKGKEVQALNVVAVYALGSRPIVVKLTPKARKLLHSASRAAGLDWAPSLLVVGLLQLPDVQLLHVQHRLERALEPWPAALACAHHLDEALRDDLP
jgi:hypothetical protein